MFIGISLSNFQKQKYYEIEKTPSFLLIGIDGVFNYGGEGIIRGTIRLLKERWPNCSITYASRQPEADTIRLSDIESLNIIQSTQRWTIKRIILGLARRLGLGEGSPLPLKNSLIKSYDAILSIGGDNYGFMDINDKLHHNTLSLVRLGECALRKRKNFVIWGASIGPFDSAPFIRDYFSRHFQKVTLITARESVTLDYLRSLGCVNNVVQVADPAFLMAPSTDIKPIPKSADEVLLGVNFSPASIGHVFGNDNHEIAKRKLLLVESIHKLLGNRNLRIVFIPHVVPLNEEINNDYVFLSELYSMLGDQQARITLLPCDLGGPRTKAILAQCDAVIGSRMHCCIAALSSGVPTIFIQYSTKALGMARYIYGNDDWCLHIKDLTPSLLYQKVEYLLKKRNELASQLQESKKKWEDDARKAVEALGAIF